MREVINDSLNKDNSVLGHKMMLGWSRQNFFEASEETALAIVYLHKAPLGFSCWLDTRGFALSRVAKEFWGHY